MRLVPLTLDYELTEFNCGDEQLNNFLYEDAKPSLELRIANTFILEDNGRIVAYFCLLNDKISKDEVIGSRWKKIRAKFPRRKQFRSYPTIKIGRFAVSQDYRGLHIGTYLMEKLKLMLYERQGQSAFRYITVDAYLSAVEFYGKNGFVHLTKKDEDDLRNKVTEQVTDVNRISILKSISDIRDSMNYLSDISKEDLNNMTEDIEEILEIIGNHMPEGEQYTSVITEQMISHTVSVNGNKDRDFIKNFVENMRTKDSVAYRKYISDNKPGVDFTIKVNIPESDGGGSFDTFLRFDDSVFINY